MLVLSAAMALFVLQGCNSPGLSKNDGLQPGINYMQPMKWRMTYRYRVQEIFPDIAVPRNTKGAYDPSIPAVGKGTYEVWMVGPREGEEVRNVKMVYSLPEPTATEKSKNTDVTYYYYDFAPGNILPKELQATVQWEFVTFERYTFWEGMQYGAYDKESELYKKYTKDKWPITSHLDLKEAARKCIPPSSPDDVVQTALNAYNVMLTRFNYDHQQTDDVEYGGSPGMYDSVRSWDLQLGQCDEFANVYCSLLRNAGIPARPCAGIVHDMIIDENDGNGYLMPGGHAWTEFYLPDYGWVPVDPTWGQKDPNERVPMLHSYLGSLREMNFPDYYFGKEDCMRLTMMKDWNYDLQPPPKTPGAKKEEVWFVGYVDRSSGVKDIIGGWQGIEPRPSGGAHGWYRSAKMAWTNFRPQIECLGPVPKSELKDVLKDIEEEGGHYLHVRPTPGNWPFLTTPDLLDAEG